VNASPRDFDIDRLFARLMLAGVGSSAACMVIGLVMFLAADDLSHGTAVVTFGLMLLMLTPALRVAGAVVEAIRARDWFFVTTTGVVILLLGLTLTLALHRVS